jgi:hypothetical protein
MTHRTHNRGLTVVAILLVLVAVGPAVTTVAAQDDDKVTVDRTCTGGFFEKKWCQFTNSIIATALNMIADFVGGIINAIIDMVVGAPVPRHNGERAIVQPPTNEPWTTIYDSWLTMAVPIGLAEWLLMVIGVLFSEVYISGQEAELKRREMKHRTWKVLFGIVGSWTIGATILHVADALAQSVAPTGEQITSNLFVFAATGQSVALAGFLMWLFGATIFLFVIILILTRIAVIFTMMWALPILLPLAALDMGPLSTISRPARGLIDMFIPFAFMTLPIAIVLQVGYLVMEGLNSSLLQGTLLYVSGANGAILLGFWIVAAVSPLFVFRKTGRIAGFAAMMAGSSISRDLGSVRDKVQDAKQDWHVPPRYDRGPETHDILDGRDASSHGGFGGDLAGGGSSQQSMLGAGASGQSSQTTKPDGFGVPDVSLGSDETIETPEVDTTTVTPNGGTTTTDSVVANGAGTTASGGTTTSTGTASDYADSFENVTQVGHPRDLPSESKYQIGMVKENGEFQPVRKRAQFSRSKILSGRYNRLNTGTRKYSDEKLLLRSKDDGSFYDIDSMTYRERSYEQMSRDTSDDVLNS